MMDLGAVRGPADRDVVLVVVPGRVDPVQVQARGLKANPDLTGHRASSFWSPLSESFYRRSRTM